MPARIAKLTPEQKAAMAPFAEKWIRIGLNTKEADFDTFEREVRRAYRFAGLGEPKTVIRVPSPIVMAIAAPIASIWIAILRKEIILLLKDNVLDSAVGSAVSSAVSSAVDSAVDSAYYYPFWGGSLWPGWLSYVAFFRDVCSLVLADDLWERFRCVEEMEKAAGYHWWHRDFVMVSDRPNAIDLDDRGRLHSETGPACGYSDGWGVYA